MVITHVFFDVGGVLGTGGWGTGERARAVGHFGIDPSRLERRHSEIVDRLEIGAITLDQYLDHAVFDQPREFSRESFKEFMRAQSHPFPDTIAIARALADAGHYRLMTINNESAELNTYRLRHFGLIDIFTAFFSSCWLGVRKPSPGIFERALQLSQSDPARAVFIDDLEPNVAAARAVGMHAIRFTSAAQLAINFGEMGLDVWEGQRCNSR